MGQTIKWGFMALALTIIINILTLAILDGHSDRIIVFISITVNILSTLGWYLLINICIKSSIKKGIYVILFYLVPYSIITLISFNSLRSEQLKDIYLVLIWTLFSKNMIPIFLYKTNIILICMFPIVSIVFLFLLSFVNKKNFRMLFFK